MVSNMVDGGYKYLLTFVWWFQIWQRCQPPNLWDSDPNWLIISDPFLYAMAWHRILYVSIYKALSENMVPLRIPWWIMIIHVFLPIEVAILSG